MARPKMTGSTYAEWKKKSKQLDRKFLKERRERERQRELDKKMENGHASKYFVENLADVYLADVYPQGRLVLTSQRCSSFKWVKDERGDY